MKNSLLTLLLSFTFLTATAQIPELWGSMSIGGSFGIGGIIKIKGDGSGYAIDYACTGGSNGGSIQTNLYPYSPTLFYGTSVSGGNNARGDIYSYNPFTKNYTMLFSMDSLSGYYPRGPICVPPNSKIYGLTNNGGVNDKGVFFEYNIVNNQYTKRHDFDSTSGALPNGGVIYVGSTNKVYGMTTSGGTNNAGVIFSFNVSNNIFTVVHDFSFANGFAGFGTLTEASNGLLYGMAFGGGSLGNGVLFSFNPGNNNYNVIYNFNSTNGAAPMGQLIEDGGTLYGCTSQGGTNNKGIIFSYFISGNTFTKLHDFDVATGSSPFGGVIRATDGKLYGMTLNGGANNLGTIYSYSLSNSLYTKIYDGSFATGGFPYADLIQFTGPTAIDEFESTKSNINIFPNPTRGEITIEQKDFSKESNLQIVNTLGQTVFVAPLTSSSTQLKLNLQPGIYFYFLQDDVNHRAGKLLVE